MAEITTSLSPEFQSLLMARLTLLRSIAARKKQVNPSADFRAVTDVEEARVKRLEAKMKKLDAVAFAAVLDFEGEKTGEATGIPIADADFARLNTTK